ncbi:MAG: RNA polymerase sigma factor [Pseudomonadales bacterium]|nr:RNA polymerase sigma factor [Pseudomonadales bacterium]
MSKIIDLFRSKVGCKEEFANMVRPHVEVMFRMAWRWTRNTEDAEDLVQDVLVKLAAKVEEMREVEDLRPWMIKVLYHRYVDVFRRERSSPFVERTDDDEADLDFVVPIPGSVNFIERLQIQDELRSAIDRLEPGHRDVILLHDVEGYTATETAEILTISPGTVKSRLHRARKKLKKILLAGTIPVVHSC